MPQHRKAPPHSPPSLSSVLLDTAQTLFCSVSDPPQIQSITSNAHSSRNNGKEQETGLLEDIQALDLHDAQTIAMYLNATSKGVDDDNDLLLERLVHTLSKLPPHSRDGRELTEDLVDRLWGVLDHPPLSSLGAEYQYRQPDGSKNNVRDHSLGAAGTPYARSCPAMRFQNPDHLPDPGDLFDTLMARADEKDHRHENEDGDDESHQSGLSSMLFYLATIITHDLFHTDSRDMNINTTSSYLDLSPLYGRNGEEQEMMRTFRNGMLKRDCFASTRILGLPPGCGVFLIMFNRFHNYVVTQLAAINEGGRFTKPSPSSHHTLDAEALQAAWVKYDESLFQTARLITSGLYVNIILHDYVRTVLNLNRVPSPWSLDLRINGDGTKTQCPTTTTGLFSSSSSQPPPAPEATGNQVSVEFNLIYRWHAVLSQKDVVWTEDHLSSLLGDQDPSTASTHDLLTALRGWESSLLPWPEARPFAGFTRLPDGSFKDEDLVEILLTSIEDVASPFGARRVPRCLRAVEILGILQARRWDVATLNEFRSFLGLTRHASFEDINPDPEIASQLDRLYDGDPDAVELYPGLMAEKTKPALVPGSGICMGYTAGRAVLSDAVGLVRGDRFYTVDYTPSKLTNWGFKAVASDPKMNGGHVMHKLILRAFPRQVRGDSVYAHFPFVIPQESKEILGGLRRGVFYSWERPGSSRGSVPPSVSSLAMGSGRVPESLPSILANNKVYHIPWSSPLRQLLFPPATDADTISAGRTGTHTFCLAGDAMTNTLNRLLIERILYPADRPEHRNAVSRFFEAETLALLEGKSRVVSTTGAGKRKEGEGKGVVQRRTKREIEIIRDVIVPVHMRFVAWMFDIPLRPVSNATNKPATAGLAAATEKMPGHSRNNSRGLSGGGDDGGEWLYTEQTLYDDILACYNAVFEIHDHDVAGAFGRLQYGREAAERLVGTLVERFREVEERMARFGGGGEVGTVRAAKATTTKAITAIPSSGGSSGGSDYVFMSGFILERQLEQELEFKRRGGRPTVGHHSDGIEDLVRGTIVPLILVMVVPQIRMVAGSLNFFFQEGRGEELGMLRKAVRGKEGPVDTGMGVEETIMRFILESTRLTHVPMFPISRLYSPQSHLTSSSTTHTPTSSNTSTPTSPTSPSPPIATPCITASSPPSAPPNFHSRTSSSTFNTSTIGIPSTGSTPPYAPGSRLSIPSPAPSPNHMSLNRPLESYLHYGLGTHRCLGRDMSLLSAVAVVKVFAGLEGLGRAPGEKGLSGSRTGDDKETGGFEWWREGVGGRLRVRWESEG